MCRVRPQTSELGHDKDLKSDPFRTGAYFLGPPTSTLNFNMFFPYQNWKLTPFEQLLSSCFFMFLSHQVFVMFFLHSSPDLWSSEGLKGRKETQDAVSSQAPGRRDMVVQALRPETITMTVAKAGPQEVQTKDIWDTQVMLLMFGITKCKEHQLTMTLL